MSQPSLPLSASAAVDTGATSGAPAAAARSFVSHAKLIGFLTFVSRLFGLARESIAAAYFGSGAVYSAFQFAFTIPNLFRKLLGEGALSAAFIPLYAQSVKAERQGSAFKVQGSGSAGDASFAASPSSTEPRPLNPGPSSSSNDFAAASVNLLCGILLALIVWGEVLLVAVVTFVDLPWDYRLAAKLTMIMLPYVLLVCGTAFLGSILQVHGRFAVIAATSVVSNLCLIVAMVSAARLLDLSHQAGQVAAVRWLSVAVLISGAIQLLTLLPSLRAAGFRFRAIFHVLTPQVRRMLLMTIPVAVSAAVLQISVLLDKSIAFILSAGPGRTVFELFGHTIPFPMAEGATQRLNWAQFMYQFPLGVFAIALATAIFPKLSEDAIGAENRDAFRGVLRRGIEASLFIGLPASLGLILVSYPAVRLLFERGEFTYADTVLVARSTAIYAGAIWAFSLQQILNRAYYALHDTTTPLVLAIVNLLLNLVIEIPLLWTPLAESGMAVGTLVAFTLQAFVMLWMLDRKVGGVGLTHSLLPIAKMVLATAAMGVACVGIRAMPFYPHGESKLIWLSQLVVLIGVGGLTYFAVCAAMGMDVTQHLRPRRRGA